MKKQELKNSMYGLNNKEDSRPTMSLDDWDLVNKEVIFVSFIQNNRICNDFV